MGRKPIEVGPTGRTVAANIARFRGVRGWTLAELSERMTEVGRPMTVATISAIENRARRADVDDLVALSSALEVSPAALLMPQVRGLADEADDELTEYLIPTSAEPDPGPDGHASIPCGQVWQWLVAEGPLDAPLYTEAGRDAHAVESWRREQVPRFAWNRGGQHG